MPMLCHQILCILCFFLGCSSFQCLLYSFFTKLSCLIFASTCGTKEHRKETCATRHACYKCVAHYFKTGRKRIYAKLTKRTKTLLCVFEAGIPRFDHRIRCRPIFLCLLTTGENILRFCSIHHCIEDILTKFLAQPLFVVLKAIPGVFGHTNGSCVVTCSIV